jgi:PTH1 family peptidyl-tRNA hydrolase
VRLVLGLGNPGARYANTRHNVAWRVLDALADRVHARPEPVQPLYAARRADVRDAVVVLLQPLTFMNASGDALAHWRAEHPGEPDALLAISDDVYRPLGRLRIRAQGGSGGHQGLESLERAWGSKEFPRLRIGVGAAESSEQLRERVRDTFAAEELPLVEQGSGEAADAVACWLEYGLTEAMNRFNGRGTKEEPES